MKLFSYTSPKNILLYFALSLPLCANAIEVVRISFSTGATVDPLNPKAYDAFSALGSGAFIDLELFDNDAPLTVANFLNYIDDGQGNRRYDGTFIHRMIRTIDLPNDGLAILQGGGYVYDPAIGAFSDVFDPGVFHIAVDPPILNEPGLSNVRGTIAMAKTSNPDSAKSEWFLNLSDNSGALDNANNSGGFTVFGQVLGDGMSRVVDSLDKSSEADEDFIPTFTFGVPSFADLPLVDFPPTPVETGQLLLVPAVERILSIDTNSLKAAFAAVQMPETVAATVRVTNRRDDLLVLDNVSLSNAVSTPFSITSNGCSTGLTLVNGDGCDVVVEFAPVDDVLASNSLAVSFQNTDLSSLAVSIEGKGAPLGPELDAPVDVDFGAVFPGSDVVRVVTLSNIGGEVGTFLEVNSLSLSGTDSSSFSLLDAGNCIGVQLFFNDSCTFSVVLDTSSGEGEFSASVTVGHSAGPDRQISLDATVTSETGLVIDSVLDFGQVAAGSVTSGRLLIQNVGNNSAVFESFTVSDGFSVDASKGCASLTGIFSFFECSLFIEISAPADAGGRILNGTLTIALVDPVGAEIDIELTALVMGDGDGISDEIEVAGPNGGDGNLDGIPDSLQGDVGSFIDSSGSYVTFETSPGLRLINLAAVDNPSVSDAPRASGTLLNFKHGFFDFVIDGVPTAGNATVTVWFPVGTSIDAWYMYGPTPGNPSNHWYQFDYNGTLGAEIIGNKVILHFVDGLAGDADLSVNGRISDPGGPASISGIESSSGGGGGCAALNAGSSTRAVPADFILLILGMVLLRCYVSRNRSRKCR